MTRLTENELRRFIMESNSIEGIRREPMPGEIEAHTLFFALPEIKIADLEALALACQPGARLRLAKGDMVRVGNHIPPAGGQAILYALQDMLDAVNGEGKITPYSIHCAYLTLHPFTDGNGRSSRALYAWHSMKLGLEGFIERGFLHQFYYDALGAADGRA